MSALPTLDVTPAESSPAITLDSLTPSERQTWRETGKFPDRSDAAPADSSPATSETSPTVSTETPVAATSEVAPPAKKGAETRKAELAAEIQDLLRQRAELRRELSTPPPIPDAKPAASSPAPVESHGEPDWEQFEAQIGTTYPTWGKAQNAFQKAWIAWKDAQTAQERHTTSERTRLEAVAQEWKQAVESVVSADPEVWSKVPGLATCVPLSVARLRDPGIPRNPTHDIAEVMITSPHKADWLRHFSAHPEVFQSLCQATSPEQVYREMGRIEATFTALAPRPAEGQPPKLSAAPAPAPTLGSKPVEALSDVDAALKAGDFRAYRAAMNRQEMAQKR